MSQRHLNVADLMTSLAAYDPRTPVRLALSPEWPFEHYVGAVTATPNIPPTAHLDAPASSPGPDSEQLGTVWIGDGGQLGYLPPEAWVELHHDPYDDLTTA
ncbi:hypothetical protein C7C46_31880 [Streptomyces tateyamensis]|uniref:Uncharacterized protein n=1 Tax=Streptomyces tateyamensis TaxID=565073 RepID=A0A2V4MSS8_9ACTN|nr:hypothetical protein [Streptomyces tateyamensis]PYC66042.1 hypothetical protein C7C46_31880 [Streptomyces tateyamensis]